MRQLTLEKLYDLHSFIQLIIISKFMFFPLYVCLISNFVFFPLYVLHVE